MVTVGDLILAYWARLGNLGLLISGLVLNLAGILLYAQSLRFEHVGVATGLFLGFNIIAVALGGYVFLQQGISMQQVTGIALIILSILMMEI